MIRAQRSLHRTIWFALAPLLLVAVLGALALRPAPLIQPPTTTRSAP